MLGANAWRFGRIGGIEIRIDPSWSVIAVLVAYSFYVLLSFEFADLATTTQLVLAILMAVVFFGSVLLHELAHSFMARARGVEVHGITLFMFGGATHADLETEDPNDELAISAVGPLSSALIAAVLWGVSALAGDGPIGFGAGWLARVNLALAVFNLAPGFPLDGGRVLRSLVWRSTGDMVRATRVASRAGQIVGWLIMGVGILQVLFLANLIGGLWLLAIGWFLTQSAQASFLQLQMRRLLSNVPAGRLMSGDLTAMPSDISIRQAVDDYFMRHDYNAFPVRDGHGVSGLVTLSAIRQVPRDDWHRPVSNVVEPLSDACTVQKTETMETVLEKLTANQQHRVIVMDGDEVVGIITPRDLARWLERSQDLGLTGSLR
ncbi:MAG TPA: site-2 protease family protein [Acidimicrobiia bacterium]|nr:site-2 protease family protein [Acidimicrobiia bacterium]